MKLSTSCIRRRLPQQDANSRDGDWDGAVAPSSPFPLSRTRRGLAPVSRSCSAVSTPLSLPPSEARAPPVPPSSRSFFPFTPSSLHTLMTSALDHNNPKRLREVLLRHSKPWWPYPTLEEALALVAFLQRLNQERRNAQVGKRVRTLSENVEPLWRTYTPRQWEHFRSMLQNILRRFRAISNVEALLPVSLAPFPNPTALILRAP